MTRVCVLSPLPCSCHGTVLWNQVLTNLKKLFLYDNDL